MGMSDELARRMDKRSKEEKEKIADRMTVSKVPDTKKDDREDKNGIIMKIWRAVRKWIGQRSLK
jgi:hypothetical protein